MAGVLHDEVGPMLAQIASEVAAVAQQSPQPEVLGHLRSIEAYVGVARTRLRELLGSLTRQPGEHVCFEVGVGAAHDAFERRTGRSCLVVQLSLLPDLDAECARVLLRVVHEALANVETTRQEATPS